MHAGWRWQTLSRDWSPQLVVIALLLVGLIYSTVYLKLPSKWWFEDDPTLFAYADGIRNPATIFLEPSVLRHFTVGKSLVPMQLLSYWCDVRLAGFSPEFAYAHQLASFLLTLLLVYLVLWRFMAGDWLTAFLVSICWAILPATAAVLQFLSTRHYLEGLLFGVLSIYILERGRNGTFDLPRSSQITAVLTAVVALLCKEIYAAVLPLVLLLYSWRCRKPGLGIVTIITACAYTAYRFWMLGPVFDYDISFLSVGEYLKFLSKLPYTVSANYGGYLIWGVILLLSVNFLRRSMKHDLGTLLCFATLLAVSLVAVLPVTYPLYRTIRFPGTWYRIVFVPNTIVIISCGYLAVRCTSQRIRIGVAIVLLAVLIPGLAKTHRVWDQMTGSAEREGKFYLNNPDKLLLSEQEAWWFIPGVNLMYKIEPPHYVLMKDLQNEQLQIPTPVWRFQGGTFVPDHSPRQKIPRTR